MIEEEEKESRDLSGDVFFATDLPTPNCLTFVLHINITDLTP